MSSMQDTKESSFFLVYSAAFLLSWVLAGISAFLTQYNPVGLALVGLTGPLIPLTGGDHSALHSDMYAIKLIVNLLWPLSIMPIQLLTMQGLKWPLWKFLCLLVGINILIAFVVQRVDLGM